MNGTKKQQKKNQNTKKKMKTLAHNKRAKYDYEILETYEAGIVLKGHEVKAVKTGKVSLKGSFVVIRNKEPYLINATISPYQPANTPPEYNPERTRKLLLKKSEINSLIGKSKQKGLTLIPLKLYTKKNKIKLEFGIGRGKRKKDKREAIKKKEADREMKRALKHRGR
ncbi:MAG: SsrA-binding protein SmpB [Candidatus Portnoybacteria bacterium]|nr:SsrA-binding protein SmpB [Candidatus Portnoybacteria bacterium]